MRMSFGIRFFKGSLHRRLKLCGRKLAWAHREAGVLAHGVYHVQRTVEAGNFEDLLADNPGRHITRTSSASCSARASRK